MKNAEILEVWEKAMEENKKEKVTWQHGKQLRQCNAVVYQTTNFYILKSYSTLIGAIEKNTRAGIDVLRYVYGYTRSSGQQLSKFFRDYGATTVSRWESKNA